MKGLSRLADEDPYLDHVEACTTNLNIKAEISGGSPRIGGVIGYAENMTISDTTIRGKIEVSVPDALNIVRLYAGGFAGEIKKGVRFSCEQDNISRFQLQSCFLRRYNRIRYGRRRA